MEAIIFWEPLYRLSATIKVLTALVSVGTVVALVRIVPSALALPGLAAVNAELRESKASLQTLLDSSRNFICLLSPEGVLLDTNRTALQAIGAQPEQVLGRPFHETPWWSHAPELQDRLRAAIRKAASGRKDEFEATHPTQDGLMEVDFGIQPVTTRSSPWSRRARTSPSATDEKRTSSRTPPTSSRS